MILPAQYQWLAKETGPKMLLEALKLYGIKEVAGSKNNDTIVSWADEIGIGNLVNDDEQAWCGLAMAICAHRAGKEIPMKEWDILRALKWSYFGKVVTVPMLSDVLIFKREGGGHVTMYVGEDETHYHCLGGNQSNMFNIVRIERNRLYAVRRPIYNNQPTNVRVIRLAPTGQVSINEA